MPHEELWLNDGTVYLNHRNIQTSPEISSYVFSQAINNHCNLKNINDFETSLVRTAYNGTENVSYPGSMICLGYCS